MKPFVFTTLLLVNCGLVWGESPRTHHRSQDEVMETGSSSVDLDTSKYYNMDEINQFMSDSAEDCGADCDVIQLTNTCLGDTMNIIKIGRSGETRPAVWLDAGTHGREWITPAAATYIIERLINEDGVDDDVTLLRDSYDWYINPVANPDGYRYTWMADRMWSKTRCDHGDGCIGVDASRNYDYMWDVEGGASTSPCQDNYRGPYAFSEPETNAVGQFITQTGGFRLMVSLHSYGQIMRHPWAYTNNYESAHIDELTRVGEIGVDAINAVHNAGYTYVKNYETISGSSMDWGHGDAGITYSYMLDLRDNGTYGYILPTDQILPTDEETWAGIKAMALEIN